jgi:hypothetical protein
MVVYIIQSVGFLVWLTTGQLVRCEHSWALPQTFQSENDQWGNEAKSFDTCEYWSIYWCIYQNCRSLDSTVRSYCRYQISWLSFPINSNKICLPDVRILQGAGHVAWKWSVTQPMGYLTPEVHCTLERKNRAIVKKHLMITPVQAIITFSTVVLF